LLIVSSYFDQWLCVCAVRDCGWFSCPITPKFMRAECLNYHWDPYCI